MDHGALAGPFRKAQSERRTVVWIDEAAFYPLPGAVRTYAPRGKTPILHALLTHDHLSAISALTLDGRLLLQIRERAFRGPEIVAFLRHLLRQIPGPLLVLWDGAPIHRAQPVKDFLAQGAAARLQLEPLPGYAPELNKRCRRELKPPRAPGVDETYLRVKSKWTYVYRAVDSAGATIDFLLSARRGFCCSFE